MFEKLIGVSPPQKGQAQDSKVDLKKDLNGTSPGQYKTEFEKALKEKLALKQKEKDAVVPNRKEAQVKKDDKELRAEKKDKKSSGGTKKKMTTKSEQQQNISNDMASKENEVEIPESKTDLAEFEANHLKTEIAAQQNAAIQPEIPELVDQKNIFEQLDKTQSQTMDESVEQLKAEPETKAYTFEQELGAQVDFQADVNPPVQSDELIQKMKAFASEKNLSVEKANDFEKSVLDQLQKLNAGQAAPAASMAADSAGQEASSQGDQDLAQKNLKTDSVDVASLQHAGQSHGEFKTHLGNAAQPAAELSHMNKLEENHDQNIKEIMNQAQYLVKKGGGEMNVKMSPDGLAEVQLKVILQDGKVNIEMQTQDKAVKKLMEDSLSELKSGLAAHHLSIEHVKINTVSATNTDNSAQFQSNQNQQGSAEQQREFWNKFQDNISQNNSRRANYASVTGATKAALAAAVERPSVQASGSLRTYGGTKGSQVNRVA